MNLGIAHEICPAIVEKLLDVKYAYVTVDSRGSGASFGIREMEWSKEEASDQGQMIEWIGKQPWSKMGNRSIGYGFK